MILEHKGIQLLIDNYKASHERWIQAFPPLLRGAFSAELFRENLFADSPCDILELHHYAGGQHAHSVEEAIAYACPLVDQDVIEKIECILSFYLKLESEWEREIAPLSSRHEQPLLCWSSLLRAVVSYSAVTSLYKQRKLRILELGPGSGYVSLMLGAAGHNVSSIDVSLGYGAWQAVLFDCFKRWAHLATLSDAVAPVSLTPDAVYSLSPRLDSGVDVIVANHMLNEMSRHSLVMFLESMHRLGLAPVIVCDGWGFGSRTDGAKNFQTESILNWFGYEIACHSPAERHLTLDGQSASDVYVIAPVTVFVKRRDKHLDNCFGATSKQKSGDGFRDLGAPIIRDEGVAKLLMIKPMDQAAKALQSIFDRFVARDKDHKPVLRRELAYLDYIGLNSNTKRPYVRGSSGYHF